tara:strand:- start:14 stop:244 length:231 start_codon:yes stop_codon:yes gene_type:complete
MSTNYTEILKNTGNVLYYNFDYYTNHIQQFFQELSNLKETILLLRRRIIQVELEAQQNKINYERLKEQVDLISLNV